MGQRWNLALVLGKASQVTVMWPWLLITHIPAREELYWLPSMLRIKAKVLIKVHQPYGILSSNTANTRSHHRAFALAVLCLEHDSPEMHMDCSFPSCGSLPNSPIYIASLLVPVPYPAGDFYTALVQLLLFIYAVHFLTPVFPCRSNEVNKKQLLATYFMPSP